MELPEIRWILLSVVVSLILYYIIKMIIAFNYWKDRNIPYEKPLPLIGNLLPVVTLKISMSQLYENYYFKFPDKTLVGIYEFSHPVLIVKDPELLEKIFIKDFQHFIDHPLVVEEDSIINDGLFQLKGKKWRSVRSKISPSLSSGKLKMMFNNMIECTDEMIQILKKNLNDDYEIREVLALYIINVIANSIFGVKLNDKQAKDEFIKHGTNIFSVTSVKRYLEVFCTQQFPKFANKFGLKIMTDETSDYFYGLIMNALEQRRQNKELERDDYVQQLLKLKHQGKIEIQSRDKDDDCLGIGINQSAGDVDISDKLLTGQAFQFISAGFDPLLISSLCLIYEIARHSDIQETARNEIKEILAKHNGFSYEAIKEMTYLEQCFQESLRLHPVAPFLMRECTKRYNIPENGLHIPKGQKLIIPLKAIQSDPKYYPEPDKYNPERFSPNTYKQKFTYMPFGDGPRICIGMKFAFIMVKLIVAKILVNYKLTLSPKTRVPFRINKFTPFIHIPSDKIYVNITPI